MQRRHDQMSPELKKDLNELLRHSMKVSQATRCENLWKSDPAKKKVLNQGKIYATVDEYYG